MAPVAKITFEDGSTAEVVVKPALMIQVERKFKGQVPPLEGTMYACWLKLRQSGQSFDEWAETVDNLEQEEPETPDPLDPAPSPEDLSS